MKMKRFFLILLGGLFLNALLFAQTEPPAEPVNDSEYEWVYEDSEGYAASEPVPAEPIAAEPEPVYEPEPVPVAVEPEPEPELVVIPPPPPPPPVVIQPAEPQPPPPQPDPVLPMLTAGSPLFHLIVLDRKWCKYNADIDERDTTTVLFKFRHGKDGYIIALYGTTTPGPVFSSTPDKSRLLVNKSSPSKAILREYINSKDFRRLVARPEVITPLKKALEDIKTTPAVLPAPNNGKIYRLQVGAFADTGAADDVIQCLKDAGFKTAQEPYGSLRRILAIDVPAADLKAAVLRLEAAGFKEVWIRE